MFNLRIVVVAAGLLSVSLSVVVDSFHCQVLSRDRTIGVLGGCVITGTTKACSGTSHDSCEDFTCAMNDDGGDCYFGSSVMTDTQNANLQFPFYCDGCEGYTGQTVGREDSKVQFVNCQVFETCALTCIPGDGTGPEWVCDTEGEPIFTQDISRTPDPAALPCWMPKCQCVFRGRALSPVLAAVASGNGYPLALFQRN